MSSKSFEEYDFMIIGSSLSNALLANVLSWNGFKVLSIDENDYYGDYTAALSLNEISAQFKDVEIKSGIISKNKATFGIDLIPSYILCESQIIKYIMNFNIYRYLEVVKLDNFYTFNSNKQEFQKLKTTKQDIFTDTSISPIVKRTIMKCIKFLVEDANEVNDIWKVYKNKPVISLFADKFSKLPENLIHEFVFTICNSYKIDSLTTSQASESIKKFFNSYNVYGNFPALLTKYGGLSELIQGIYRSAALIGNILRLGTNIKHINGNEIELSDGEKVVIKERIIVSNYQTKNLKALGEKKLKSDINVFRSNIFIKKDDANKLKWCYDSTNGSLITYPAKSKLIDGEELENTVQVLVLSDLLERTPSGYICCSLMGTNETDLKKIINTYELENDVVLKFSYQQNINHSSNFDKSFVLITSDVQEPLSLDLDQYIDVATRLFDTLVNSKSKNSIGFMSVNLPNNDE
ncbi:hypothetical protein QEN19_003444 [Hanseniaspora menglaensis]